MTDAFGRINESGVEHGTWGCRIREEKSRGRSEAVWHPSNYYGTLTSYSQGDVLDIAAKFVQYLLG